jgi:hypothetical protein
VATGHTNIQIARRLSITEGTVGTHLETSTKGYRSPAASSPSPVASWTGLCRVLVYSVFLNRRPIHGEWTLGSRVGSLRMARAARNLGEKCQLPGFLAAPVHTWLSRSALAGGAILPTATVSRCRATALTIELPASSWAAAVGLSLGFPALTSVSPSSVGTLWGQPWGQPWDNERGDLIPSAPGAPPAICSLRSCGHLASVCWCGPLDCRGPRRRPPPRRRPHRHGHLLPGVELPSPPSSVGGCRSRHSASHSVAELRITSSSSRGSRWFTAVQRVRAYVLELVWTALNCNRNCNSAMSCRSCRTLASDLVI